MTKNSNSEKLKLELRQFSGTEKYYYNPLFPFYRYTDGVKYLVENAECYWLLDFIFSEQEPCSLECTEFQVWQIKVKEDNSAILTIGDGNNTTLSTFEFSYTTFPFEEFTLWMVDDVLILPSEY